MVLLVYTSLVLDIDRFVLHHDSDLLTAPRATLLGSNYRYRIHALSWRLQRNSYRTDA